VDLELGVVEHLLRTIEVGNRDRAGSRNSDRELGQYNG
jgi:hypothetical protein